MIDNGDPTCNTTAERPPLADCPVWPDDDDDDHEAVESPHSSNTGRHVVGGECACARMPLTSGGPRAAAAGHESRVKRQMRAPVWKAAEL
mmetsp:Transcript_50689/g.132598  ORF Transcript_50689/g.132598 Transcript_50689/m.132598 type:complete len:90 (-) Transcript_50689:47-316(-)